MRLPLYQVDAFVIDGKPFSGNPAAVVPLTSWPPDHLLQAIAAENNLAETAFFVATGDSFHMRWFTPVLEVDLCGHATLATAATIMEKLTPSLTTVRFTTQTAGTLSVRRIDNQYELDFPALPPQEISPPPGLAQALGAAPTQMLAASKNLAVFTDAATVRAMKPNLDFIKQLDRDGLIVTAPSDTPDHDFVSRYFAPHAGIDEDPATGSAHCILVPYWAKRLKKTTLAARQASARGADFSCTLKNDRVLMRGKIRFYLEGNIEIPG